MEQATDVAVAQHVEEGLRWRVLALHGQCQYQVVHQLVFADVLDIEAVLRYPFVHIIVRVLRVTFKTSFVVF